MQQQITRIFCKSSVRNRLHTVVCEDHYVSKNYMDKKAKKLNTFICLAFLIQMNQTKRITLQTDVNATCAIRHTLALSVLGLGFLEHSTKK